MKRNVTYVCLCMVILVQSLFAAQVVRAETSFGDLRGHWATEYIEKLENLGVYKPRPDALFYPDKPISRGEALVLFNRVFEVAYGRIGKPMTSLNLDSAYPMKGEMEQLLGNLDKAIDAEIQSYSKYNPGERMLYLLNLSARKKKMKEGAVYESSWYLPKQQLMKSLTREEASMLLMHMLAPQLLRQSGVPADKVAGYFTSIYEWKLQNDYVDVVSPYASLIRDSKILTANQQLFLPDQVVTRAQFSVILSRLYEYYKEDVKKQMESINQMGVKNLFLTRAAFAYQNQDVVLLQQYYGNKALETLKEITPLPLHELDGQLKQIKEDTRPGEMRILGIYENALTGKYQVEYYMIADKNKQNPYGWKIEGIEYQQK